MRCSDGGVYMYDCTFVTGELFRVQGDEENDEQGRLGARRQTRPRDDACTGKGASTIRCRTSPDVPVMANRSSGYVGPYRFDLLPHHLQGRIAREITTRGLCRVHRAGVRGCNTREYENVWEVEGCDIHDYADVGYVGNSVTVANTYMFFEDEDVTYPNTQKSPNVPAKCNIPEYAQVTLTQHWL